MILGNYWSMYSPDKDAGLRLFRFIPNPGGHGDAPAELQLVVETTNPDEVVRLVKDLCIANPDCLVTIEQVQNHLAFSISDYFIFHYEICIAVEIEKIVSQFEFKVIKDLPRNGIRLKHVFGTTVDSSVPSKLFQVVGSPKRENNSETRSLRLDVNLGEGHETQIIDQLILLQKEVKFRSLVVIQGKYKDRRNLMIFVSDGDQGVSLKRKRSTNVVSLEIRTLELLERCEATIGFVGKSGGYPQKQILNHDEIFA